MSGSFRFLWILAGALILLMGVSAPAQHSTYFFPHVVDGGYIFLNEFWFHNVQDTPTQVALNFYDEAGAPWVVDLRSREGVGGHQSEFNFVLQPYASVYFFTGAVDPLKVGWAKAETSQPVNASASFTFFDGMPDPTRIIWSAGVLPSAVGTQFSFAADVSLVGDTFSDVAVDIGFAVINPGTDDAHITATLIPVNGTAAVSTKTIDLAAGGHYSRFLSELFNDVTWGDRWHGLVRLSSNVNISAVALKHIYNANSDIYCTLSVLPDASLTCHIAYDVEDNDSFAAAQPIAAPVEVIGTSNSPSDGADSDYFAISLTAGQTIYVMVMADAIGSPLDDTLRLFNPAQSSVGYVDDPTPGLLDPQIMYTAPASGTYYIQRASVGGTSSRESSFRMFVKVK
jgi:hypothetical protein